MYHMKMVKIVTEKKLESQLVSIFDEIGLRGFTIFDAHGRGEHGLRSGETTEKSNIAVEVVLSSPNADILMRRLREDFLPRYAMAVYVSDVEVIRHEKFM